MIDNTFNLNKKDDYSAALMLLFIASKNPRYSTLSELSYILDYKNFLNFIKYYEGQTIQIPPLNEIQDSLRILMMYEYYVVEEFSWKQALSKAGFEESESISVRQSLSALKRYMRDFKIGDVLNDK